MKTPYVSELEPNQLILGVFLVQHKEIRQKKTGEPYLSLTLADRTGDLDAKMWDNVPEVMDTFDRDSFLKVKGMVQLFQNKPQLTVYRLQRLAETEIDISDFLPASRRNRDEMFAELKGWIASMSNPHLKALLETIFADEAVALAYRTAPAAKSIHHGWIGGLGKNPVAYMSSGAGGVPVMPMYFVTKSTFALIWAGSNHPRPCCSVSGVTTPASSAAATLNTFITEPAS